MLTLVGVLGVGSQGRGDPTPDEALLGDQPATSLIRRLEWNAAELAGGLSVSVSHRRLSVPGMLWIDTTLVNGGPSDATLAGIVLGDWTFRVVADSDALRYRPLTYRSDTWYGSTFWSGPDWTRVGRDWHHPGTDTPSVRRFVCPRDGRITISGRIYKADTKPSDGVRLSIRHRDRDVWQAEIDGPDSQGVEPNLTLDVRRGDSIRFVVHKRGEIFCDTTHWDPLVTYDDGPAYRASDGFSTTEQGEGGWFYEMLADENAAAGLPSVRYFDRDLLVRGDSLRPGRNVRCSGQDALPLLILSDSEDQSGILVALTRRTEWSLTASLDHDGRMRVRLSVGDEKAPMTLKPGGSVDLPPMLLGAYRGPWPAATSQLQDLLDADDHDSVARDLADQLSAALARHAPRLTDQSNSDRGAKAALQPSAAETIPLDLWALVQTDWRQADKIEETASSYAAATAEHLAKARALLMDLRAGPDDPFLAAEAEELERIAYFTARDQLDLDARRTTYFRLHRLKRRIALANPLMDFEKLLFAKRVPTSYSHLVMQYYGWRARPGGGIFVLNNPGRSLACRDILDGRLASGNVLRPVLSYDARRIVFSFVQCPQKPLDAGEILNDSDEGFYHLWEVNVDGTGLRQVTDGPYDDLMPAYLPDGGIVFTSTRRRGYARCFGGQFSRRWHVYTLHRVESDGSNLRALSFHDTNEWFPTVSHTGHILYARWDYIDRDAVTHQNLWSTRPDGTNPVAVWGNATSSPHCTFQLQPIPDTPKVVFTASAHHSIAGGSIAVVDPTVAHNGQEAITRITPEVPFPEAEGRKIDEYYTAPWPLSEKYFLVGYSPKPLVWEPGANDSDALGIYLLDKFGNRELIYRQAKIGSTNPCPLVPRRMPPVLPSTLPEEPVATGEMVLADVYRGLGDVPRGSVTELRVVQIFPKTTNVANVPPIGLAREENGRAILGTVPVEPDGSARFLVPAGKPLLFQALDEKGFARQTMRTVTYVQPGERVSCAGCHENRMSTPVERDTPPAALARPPSTIDPGPLGGRPFSYVEVVQPVLDKHCVACHGGGDTPQEPEGGLDLTGSPHAGFTKSYVALMSDVDFWAGGTNPENAAKALVPRFGGRNPVQVTPPGGLYGALGSRLMRLLAEGHEDVALSADETRRLAAWIDMNAIFYGVNLPEDQARQLNGQVVAMPEIQ
jgi:hypothetical protein